MQLRRGELAMSVRRVIGVFCCVLGITAVARADVSFVASDVPTIFYIDKSDDRNRVDYGIRLDASCHPSSSSPMVVYWREFEHGHGGRVTHGLNVFEGPVYGVGTQRVIETRDDGVTMDVTVRALSSRRLAIRTRPGPSGCTATAVTRIGGREAVLHHVHLTLDDGPGIVRFADLYGVAVDDGTEVTEHIVR